MMRLSNYNVFLSLLIAIFSPFMLQRIHAQVNVLMIGDWGADPNSTDGTIGYQLSTRAGLTSVAGSISPRASFVISLGDNFYGWKFIPDSNRAAMNNMVLNSFTNMYNSSELQVRWYMSLGNHDYQGNVDDQLSVNIQDPRWYLPSRYYTFDFPIDALNSATVVVLDTNPAVYASAPESAREAANILATDAWSVQLAWFRNVMASSSNAWKIVIGHHTICTSTVEKNFPQLIADISPILEQYGAPYINGHLHDMEHCALNGINYYTSGSGGQLDKKGGTKSNNTILYQYKNNGFSSFYITPQTFTITYYMANGSQIYQHSMNVPTPTPTQPSTTPPSTAPPSTAPPSTVPPSTAPPSTTQPPTSQSPTTAPVTSQPSTTQYPTVTTLPTSIAPTNAGTTSTAPTSSSHACSPTGSSSHGCNGGSGRKSADSILLTSGFESMFQSYDSNILALSTLFVTFLCYYYY